MYRNKMHHITMVYEKMTLSLMKILILYHNNHQFQNLLNNRIICNSTGEFWFSWDPNLLFDRFVIDTEGIQFFNILYRRYPVFVHIWKDLVCAEIATMKIITIKFPSFLCCKDNNSHADKDTERCSTSCYIS